MSLSVRKRSFSLSRYAGVALTGSILVTPLLQPALQPFLLFGSLTALLLLGRYGAGETDHAPRYEHASDSFQASLEADMKLTEAVMHAQALKYSAIFNAVTHGMLISNGSGIITEANPAACTLLHRPAARIIGQSLTDVLPSGVIPGTTRPEETVLAREDGSSVSVEMTRVPFSYLGESFLATFIKDVTEQQRAEAVIRRNREVEQTIHYFATSLFGQNTEDEILWDIAKNCIEKLGFEDCVIYLLDESGECLVQKAAYGPKNPQGFEIMHPLVLPLGRGIVGSVASTGRAEIIDDTLKDARYVVDDETRRSEITVPICSAGKVLGIIDSEHSQPGFFKPEHLNILQTIAGLCANKLMRVRVEDEARRTQLKLAEYRQKMAEFKLMALRSQMNPHFIFNSLNSIQHLITLNDRPAAQEYLSMFSRLLRQILESSLHSRILLADEIEILQYYLRMEALRFENRFEYLLEVDDTIDPYEAELPALLIQPYVENAIVHGLINKATPGHLKIQFRDEAAYIRCIIEDNGIGRSAAAEIKRRRLIGHTSVGMRLSQERLDLINRGGTEQVLVQITDLTEGGQPAGTRVEILIPQ